MKYDHYIDEAKSLIQERGLTYGLPTHTAIRVSKLWSAWLEYDITPEDYFMLMVLLKIARLQETHDHSDSIQDGIAYLGLFGQAASTDWDDLDSY